MTPLLDVADVIYGFPFPSSGFRESLTSDGLPVVRIRDVVAGVSTTTFVGDYSPTYLVADGDMLIGMDGQFNLARWQGGRALLNQRVCKVVPRPGKVDERYLFWALPRELQAIEDRTPFVTVKHLSAKAIAGITLNLPSLPEQRRIADILDKADAIRRKRKEAIALTEELLRSVFLEMFGDPVTNPKGWDVKPLGSVADIASGVAKGKKYNDQPMVTLPYMRVANVQDGHIVLDEVKTISVSKDDGHRYRLEPGDVLLTEGGDPDKLGRGAVWRGEVTDCIHQNHIFRVRPSDDVKAEYLSAIIGSERGKRYFLRAAKQTTGIASINMTQLRSFPVLVPPMSLQERYVSFVAKSESLRERQRRKSALIDELFGSLVHRAFHDGALTRHMNGRRTMTP